MGETAKIVILVSLLQHAVEEFLRMLEKTGKSNQDLRSTLNKLSSLFREIRRCNDALDRPIEEVNALVKESDGASSSCGCDCSYLASIWVKCFSWIKLWLEDGGDAHEEEEALIVNDIEETLCQVRKILEQLSRDYFESRRSCDGGVPQEPGFTVGLEEPLRRLKTEVLRDGGVSVFVLTGIGGSGKTTLATRLCLDEQVKGKFKENILFVTFSETPKLKIIVERLFEVCGYNAPEFRSDKDAVNHMGAVLRHIGKCPILLVLDDVWPGSEALVEKFIIQIPDYKILVTSRVAFPRFGTPYTLKPLDHEDAMALFHHFALLEKSCSSIPDEDVVHKVVRGCRGSPLAITVTARSLSCQPYDFWLKMVDKFSQGHSILGSNAGLLNCLQKILEVLENKPIAKECFMDLGLFPEDQRIPLAALLDIWNELYRLDDNNLEAMAIIDTLESMNLINLLVARKNAYDTDNDNYNNHFIVLHDLLRQLAIHQSSEEPIEYRTRLAININANTHEWWPRQKQNGMIMSTISKYLRWCIKPKPLQLSACTLSISTYDSCISYWSDMKITEAKVLIFHLRAKQFSFPELTEKMNKLIVLIVTNYGFHPSKLNNTEQISSLQNLKTIRLERISVPRFGILKNLRKLSLYMCNTSEAFRKSNILISEAFPNLEDLSIDYCKDMVALPSEVCDIASLKKLSVTNCHKLSLLPEEIGNLRNLELLRLSSCTDLEGLPDSIVRLSNLRLLDISNCISLPNLPEDIGNLSNLRNLYMSSCSNCELPFSVTNLQNLKVVCDEETATSWEDFVDMAPNLQIEVPRVDVNLNWLHPK